ncbi:MAG: redoxin domain-containing protein [Planctomycetia bacterium]|nr:redoxin domain-containing protein [Planctomycetia bacterium]
MPTWVSTWVLPVLLIAVVLTAALALPACTEAGPAEQRGNARLEAIFAHNEVAARAEEQNQAIKAPELTGGVAWLNTAKPLTLKELKGKIVILDFWTLCCINCIHVLPDLAKLEKKYPNELVVIGVHSPKFDNEKETESIKKAILRYEVKHPVVNDAEMKIWKNYQVSSWPTMYVIDPEGNVYRGTTGEGNYETVDKWVKELIDIHKKKKTLNEKPIDFDLLKEQAGPLFFPGKVLADAEGKRLFIADSTHHRIVVTDLDGKKLAIAGAGTAGKADGAFDKATFNDPQGMALKGDTLYVADRKNHSIRALDLKAQTVKTVAGTGEQSHDREALGPALKVGLNSPWDLCLVGNDLYIAMAGHHQIWLMDLAKGTVRSYAGDGVENIRDGQLMRARFSQPSGLATDGKSLYVADSEISAIRSVPLGGKGQVATIVGKGLFDFGDIDGEGDDVRLQHALGVIFVDGKLYVADTYNSKLKVLDPEKRTSKNFLPEKKEALFNEPAGLSYANGKIYVADTNAHRIRVVDLKSKEVSTLARSGVEAPKKQ